MAENKDKKSKKIWELEKGGTPRLGEVELEQRLALRGTQGENVQEDEIYERIRKLEDETTPEDLEKELEEAVERKKKQKR